MSKQLNLEYDSVHEDASLSISVTLQRTHHYTSTNGTTVQKSPGSGYSGNGNITIDLSTNKKSIEEALSDPEVINDIAAQIRKGIAAQVKERDAFVGK